MCRKIWSNVLVVCTILLFNLSSQAKKDISAILEHLKKHYDERLATFKKENQSLKNIIFLGDSLTEGFDLKRYFPGLRTLNRGIVADHIGVQGKRGVLQRLDVSVFDCNPSMVFLMIGVNDLADSDYDFTQLVSGYREIIRQIQTRMPGVTIIVQSCLPTRGKYQHLNPLVLRFNKKIKEIAQECACPYLDLHSLFVDEKGELRKELTRDGVHLTKKGYDIWASAVRKMFSPSPHKSK